MSERKLKNSGATSEVSLDKSKNYKYDKAGALVEATTIGDNDIVFSGSKSSLRRLSDLERNVSILAATLTTTDGGTTDAEDSNYLGIFTDPQRFKSTTRFDAAVSINAAVAMNSNKITGLGTPTATADAATKSYVDSTATTAISAAAADATTKANAAKPVAGTGISVSGTTITNTITNTNQLTNGAGFITGYTETSTLDAVLARGASTSRTISTGHIVSTGTGNDYNVGGIELCGNGTTNTVFPTLGFHQPGLFAASLQARSGSDFRFYAQGATGYASLTVASLSAVGNITATGEITAYYSDVNLKKDIVAITDPIAKVMALRGVTYRPNQTALDLGITDKEEVGVIAQEVEAVLPQLVCPSAFDGFKTVKYDKLTALLLEAVKAQQTQIEALTAQVAKLSGQ